jgi:hypothetical protein
MEIVKSLMEMVSKLSCEFEHLKSDNTALRLQLRDLHQIHAPLPSIQTGVVSSVAAKTYRDVLSSGGGNTASTPLPAGPSPQPPLPESSVTAKNNPSGDGFITVLGKSKGKPSSSISSGMPKPPKETRTPLFGARSGSSLSTVQKKVRTKALFVTRFSPDVSSADVEQSLKDQLELASLTCTKLKTKFNSYSSFHIAVSQDDFDLINNTGIWPIGCLIAPYYGRLNPEQIYCAEKSDMSRPPSPLTDVPTLDHVGGSVNTDGAQVEGTDTLG